MSSTSGRDHPLIDRVARNVASSGSLTARIRETLTELVSRTSATAGGEIKVSSISHERIVGRLSLGSSGLLFDSRVAGNGLPKATVRTLSRRELVSLSADHDTLTVRFGEGGAIVRTGRTDTQTFGADPKQAINALELPRRTASIQGDRRALDAFYHSHEFALLPELSYALGLAGATGARYRPSLALHSLGMSAAEFLGVDPARPGVTYRWKLPRSIDHFWIRFDARAFFDRLAPTDCWTPNQGVPNVDGLPICPGDDGCEAWPNEDRDCFGMCGPGCTICWSWVCGDCCFHDFCAEHDALLRSCEGAEDVVLCLGSILVLPTRLLGCDHGWFPF
jgi:hypothetical protein